MKQRDINILEKLKETFDPMSDEAEALNQAINEVSARRMSEKVSKNVVHSNWPIVIESKRDVDHRATMVKFCGRSGWFDNDMKKFCIQVGHMINDGFNRGVKYGRKK
jgi:hypothetical protein